MNDPSRPNASLITDDQLDALYAELDALRALVARCLEPADETLTRALPKWRFDPPPGW